jgi:hypothetical protein
MTNTGEVEMRQLGDGAQPTQNQVAPAMGSIEE